MLRRILPPVLAAGLVGLLVPLLAATPAAAHEERTLGRYHVAVGFGDEPAYVGEKNSVQLLLHDANDKAVTDLGDTLKVDVSTAGGATPLARSIEPFFEIGESGTPGDYRAFFIPTAPGRYTFHFTGTIKGQRVDASFTSSPTGFAEVEDPASVEFPSQDPTTGQLAQRLDREVPRLDAALQAAGVAQEHADATAKQARLLAIVGIAAGVLGIAAGVAFGRRKQA